MKLLIHFYANINESTVNDTMLYIAQQINSSNPTNPIDEIVIQIASTGGSSESGILIHNYLKQIHIPITTIGMGNVDSAAVMLFGAGQKRLSLPNCRFVLHGTMTQLNGTFTYDKLAEFASINKNMTDEYSKVLAKICDEKTSKLKKLIIKGTTLDAGTAKDLGLVQEIIDGKYIEENIPTNIFVVTNPKQQ